jgi:hypothetical protein
VTRTRAPSEGTHKDGTGNVDGPEAHALDVVEPAAEALDVAAVAEVDLERVRLVLGAEKVVVARVAILQS